MTDSIATSLARPRREAATGAARPARTGLLHPVAAALGLHATRTGATLALGALEDKFWARACEGLGLDTDLRDDGRDPAATKARVAALVRARDAAHWRAVPRAARLLRPRSCARWRRPPRTRISPPAGCSGGEGRCWDGVETPLADVADSPPGSGASRCGGRPCRGMRSVRLGRASSDETAASDIVRMVAEPRSPSL